MKSSAPRIFKLDDGKEARFYYTSFCDAFNSYKETKHLKISEAEEALAEAIHVSSDAVHNWRSKSNGPNSLAMVKSIAAAIGVSDWTMLVKEVKEENTKMNKLSDLQMQSVKKIYDCIVDFLNEFYHTNGFTGDFWFKFNEKYPKDTAGAIYDYINGRLNVVHDTLKKEYLFLHNQPIYEELCEFAYNDLYDTYNEKIGPACRIVVPGENKPTTYDDFMKAYNRLNEIAEKWV